MCKGIKPLRQLAFLIAGLGFIALIGYWSYSTESPAIISSRDRGKTIDTAPDFFIKDIVIQEFDTRGDLESTLISEEVSHFPHNDIMLLTQPDLWTYEKDRQPWHTTADNGRILPDGETIELINNVVMRQKDENGESELRVDTPFLTVYSGQEYADTDAPVRLLNSTDVVNAMGIRVFYKQDFIRLKSRVNSIHESR